MKDLTIPNNGKPELRRNPTTGAVWLVSFDYTSMTYLHEPIGNLRNIKRSYSSLEVDPRLVPAGTH